MKRNVANEQPTAVNIIKYYIGRTVHCPEGGGGTGTVFLIKIYFYHNPFRDRVTVLRCTRFIFIFFINTLSKYSLVFITH